MQAPIINCYSGYGDSDDGIWLDTNQLYEDDAQIVTDNPTLFTTVLILDGGTPTTDNP